MSAHDASSRCLIVGVNALRFRIDRNGGSTGPSRASRRPVYRCSAGATVPGPGIDSRIGFVNGNAGVDDLHGGSGNDTIMGGQKIGKSQEGPHGRCPRGGLSGSGSGPHAGERFPCSQSDGGGANDWRRADCSTVAFG